MVLIIQLLLSTYLKQIATPSGPQDQAAWPLGFPLGSHRFPLGPRVSRAILGSPARAHFRLLSSQLLLTHPLAALESLNLVPPKPCTPALVGSVP